MEGACEQLRTKLRHGFAYHPQSQGIAEATVKYCKKQLRMGLDRANPMWSNKLEDLLYHVNHNPKNALIRDLTPSQAINSKRYKMERGICGFTMDTKLSEADELLETQVRTITRQSQNKKPPPCLLPGSSNRRPPTAAHCAVRPLTTLLHHRSDIRRRNAGSAVLKYAPQASFSEKKTKDLQSPFTEHRGRKLTGEHSFRYMDLTGVVAGR